ncbi:site-specific integrase, partial [Vibrio sp. 10N.261.45.A7]
MDTYYQIQISSIPNFVYKKPLVSIDENGEPQVTYRANGNTLPIKKLPLLYIAGYDDKDNLISYQPLDMVNEFLLSKAIDDGVLELGTDAQGLAHYFSFVLDKQEGWDAEYDEGDFDPLY